MEFFVREFTSESGEERAVLVNDQGSPSFWTNVYVISDYLNTGASPRTISKVLRTFAMAHTYAASNGFDLDKALSVGELISIEQAEGLAHYLRMNAKSQKEANNNRKRTDVSALDKVPRLEQLQALKKGQKKEAVVSAPAGATRIRWVANYIEWHLARRLGSLDRAKKDSSLVKDVGATIVARLRKLAPKERKTSVDEAKLEGVSNEICAIAEELFRPRTQSNPFTPGFHQERNYLIWRFFYETGMRREELRELLVEKVDYSLRRVQITKSKTLTRTVPISELLALKFHDFIMNHWSKIPARQRKHGFLFTTKNGVHLGLNSINLVFRTARRSDERLPDFLAPHVMRRTWNDRFIDLEAYVVKGDERHLKEAKFQVELHLRAVQQCQEAIANGEPGVNKWLNRHQEHLDRWHKTLSMLENPEIPVHTIITLPSPIHSQAKSGLAHNVRQLNKNDTDSTFPRER